MMNLPPLHNFHIPVMGLAYTIDTPVKVARFGIDSVVSIIEDKLVERMRQHYYKELDVPFKPISQEEDDYRARRITDYLNLVNGIIKAQIKNLKNTAFVAGSEISKYFEMLPGNNRLRLAYDKLMNSDMEQEKEALTKFLKSQVRPGRIDVNIMTKVDKDNHDKQGNLIADSSDALSALRGYANSDLTNSAIVFSAGLNPRLFNYLEKLPAFNANGIGDFDKKVIIKVSDFRSALIQGKYLAKKGIWVSEFRIESGLNCGGHAFASNGNLIGPILEEFKNKREELISSLHSLYVAAIKAKDLPLYETPHPIAITVQGGIGTYAEADFLQTQYGVNSTGWGTPFLLCPEATTVDDPTMKLLTDATEEDIMLSKNSPLGIRFNYLKGTSSEKEKLARIGKGKPGSPCTEKHLVSNTEFTKDPICTASSAYQKRKIEQLKEMKLPIEEYKKQFNDVVNKECLCIGLSNAAIIKYDLPPVKNLTAVTICPGPNIAYFNKTVTLREITDHIYGRTNILADQNRPHMFLKELQLNVEYLKEQANELKSTDTKQIKDVFDFVKQLLAGIEYYRGLTNETFQSNFKDLLSLFETEISNISKEILRRFETK
ncbi:MAG: hypothetical protein DI538_07015 [Azospira oryzae]|nr:MAG: hypothetical protein DI538_07015 [Azospira oryzae]